MKIIKHNENYEIKEKTAVALGNFDGLHVGHQSLIKCIVEESLKRNLQSSVLLFNNHTRTVASSKSTPKILTTNEQKISILESFGVNIVYFMNFNKDIMKLSPEEFAQKILVGKLNAKLVVVGFNYRFGYKASGDSEYLKKLGSSLGFDVMVIGPVYSNENVVSSTLIRNLLKNGKVEEANKLLDRPYTIVGKVIKGKQRGTSMGFPTANLEFNSNYLIPKIGVYRTITVVNGIEYISLTNVGNNPTFKNDKISIETHILNFQENLYGKTIKVKFINFIREEKEFDNRKDLTKQVIEDINTVKMS